MVQESSSFSSCPPVKLLPAFATRPTVLPLRAAPVAMVMPTVPDAPGWLRGPTPIGCIGWIRRSRIRRPVVEPHDRRPVASGVTDIHADLGVCSSSWRDQRRGKSKETKCTHKRTSCESCQAPPCLLGSLTAYTCRNPRWIRCCAVVVYRFEPPHGRPSPTRGECQACASGWEYPAAGGIS